MTPDKPRGERVGRTLGERIGRALGANIGRAVGELIGQALTRDEQTDSSSDAETSEERPHPETRDELETMSYRELQSLAKELGVKANLTTEEMTDRLAAELDMSTEAESESKSE